ncbi:MAG: TatD family hydrolase [Bacteroidales bacterium]|nr:TatD family hydrolase [Bacteroidales bacterium]
MSPFVNIHTHQSHIDNKEFIEIYNIDVDSHVNVDVTFFYSIGIHPWKCQQSTVNGPIVQWLNNSTAIGECGIDRVCGIDIEIQKDVFIKQIGISEKYNKPMIIHAVRSHSDIISIRKETKAKMPWIIHGFQGNEQIVIQYLRHNIYLSLGDVLFKNESRAAELLKIIPTERLFLETDDSERSIVDVYEKASVLSGRSLEDLRSDIFNNFVKIFGKI